MKLSHAMLNKAVAANIITSEQAEVLFDFIKNQPGQQSNFNTTTVLYYFGGLVAMGAMTLFLNLGFEKFGGLGIFLLCLVYALLGLWLAHIFANKAYPIPAGICATFVIALTPLAIYGLQRAFNLWPDETTYHAYHVQVKWHWLIMELGTLLVGVILAWFYRYPFMIMPIAFTLWYMSMDLTDMLAGPYASIALSAMISMCFGLAVIALAFWVDLRSKHGVDYAFWLYIVGVLAFWGGLSLQPSDSELAKFFYLCINLVLIGAGVLLMRKVFVIFGAIGISIYLGYLASQVFKDSMFFPIALVFIGLFIIYLGTLWQKHETLLTQKTQFLLPLSLRKLLQERQDE